MDQGWKAAPSGLRVHLQPFLEESAALQRGRCVEFDQLRADLQRAKQATARFRELVLHVSSGKEFVTEVQEVMEGAEARLHSLRQRHEESLLDLHNQELALTQARVHAA